jgi:hypothetical protein
MRKLGCRITTTTICALLCGATLSGARSDIIEEIDPQLIIVPFVSCGGATTWA